MKNMKTPMPEEISELEKRIETLSVMKRERPITVNWYAFEDALDRTQASRIRSAYENCDEDQKIELTVKLWQAFTAYMRGGNLPKEDFLRLFGDGSREGNQYMGTITSQGGQLRIWSGFPSSIRSGHADSC